MTPGGGGWGNPCLRPKERVFEEYLTGIISYKSCVNDYGVVLTKSRKSIDQEETKIKKV